MASSLPRLTRAALALGAAFLSSGCLFLPGPRALERIKAERPSRPYGEVTFSVEPQDGQRPLEEFRVSLEYWAGDGSGGTPRWRGILEPHPGDLYDRLLRAIDSGASEIRLVSYRYDAAGFDHLTLVDYFDGDGNQLGWDHVVYPETTPADDGPAFVGYDDLAWWEYPMFLLDLPIYLAIGLKEFVGETVKSPLSAIDTGWVGTPAEGRNPVSPVCFTRAGKAFAEDWRNGWTALTWRFRARRRHTPLDLLRDLLGTMPIVGPFFDHKSPPETREPPPETTVVAVGQGIHVRGDAEQFAESWRRAVEEQRPGATVVTLPYRYGGFIDTTWSMLNISSGMGYDVAERLVFEQGVTPTDGVELVGFSGSAQRYLVATRALRLAGIHVNRVVGVAGPVAGTSCADENRLLLGDNPWLDPVVLTAHLVDFVYAPLPTNIQRIEVPGAGGHHLPYFPNATTRAPESGYREALRGVLRP